MEEFYDNTDIPDSFFSSIIPPLFKQNKPIDVFGGTVDQEIGIGDDSSCKNRQEFSTSCHNPQKSSPRKGRFSAEDERRYHRNEAAHIQDMLKRLQMLEELHHAQDLIGISVGDAHLYFYL